MPWNASCRRASLKVLTGPEVDIRPDGSLDYIEETLRELDVVVASVHSAIGQERERMGWRIMMAMRNQYVTVNGKKHTPLTLRSSKGMSGDYARSYGSTGSP